jgi:hypothetical protein
MKTLLLKRMDSSFYAFKETLNRFILSSKIMLKMIKSNAIISVVLFFIVYFFDGLIV